MKELLKKHTEVNHLLRFRQNFPAFPNGMSCVGEAPDFLVNTGHGYVGIEHTQWFRESDSPGGSRMCARESKEDKVLRLALSRYEGRRLPPVWVNVLWSLQGVPTSRIPELANALADLVEVYLPKQDGEVTNKASSPPWRSLPWEVSNLSYTLEKNPLEESLGPRSGLPAMAQDEPNAPQCGWYYNTAKGYDPWWEYWCWWPGWGWEFVFWVWD